MALPSPFDFGSFRRSCLRDDAFRSTSGTLANPAPLRGTGGLRGSCAPPGAGPSGRNRSGRPGGFAKSSDARGLRSATPRDPVRRGGTAAVDFDQALEVSRELNARDVVVDYRPGVGIRLSPHFYTEDAELDRAFAAIDEIRESGAWRRWREHRRSSRDPGCRASAGLSPGWHSRSPRSWLSRLVRQMVGRTHRLRARVDRSRRARPRRRAPLPGRGLLVRALHAVLPLSVLPESWDRS